MAKITLDKNQTGVACEFLVAGELARRAYNVTLTFGKTKAIDLIVEKDKKLIPIQVKGMQRTATICWNISRDIRSDAIYIFVNLHADTFAGPEYFVLTGIEVKEHLKEVKSKRDYIDYNAMKRLSFQDRWGILEKF